MPATNIAFITFVCTFGSALGAAYLRRLLPAPHLAKESQDVVRLGIGLVATMTALLLGIVTASARGTFDEQDRDVRNSAVNILTLDRYLARYGAETRETRELIKRAVAFRLANTWPSQGAAGYGEALSIEAIESIEDRILSLSPQSDAQRWFKNESIRLATDVVKTRWRLLQNGARIPGVFLAVVIFWLTVTFASFGLYAPENATVISVLFIAALSVSGAMFLLVELDGPFDGVIRVSGDTLQFTLGQLGK